MAIEISKEPFVSHKSSTHEPKKKVSNVDIWLFCLACSLLSLLIVPFGKFSRLDGYNGISLFIDVFGSIGICMITASMSIAALFESLAVNRISNKAWLGLALVAIACYLVHTAMTFMQEDKNTPLLLVKIAWVNVFLFGTMFLLSMKSLSKREQQ